MSEGKAENDVHHRVARLSITVDEDNERKQFLTSIAPDNKSQVKKQLNSTINEDDSAIADEEDESEKNANNKNQESDQTKSLFNISALKKETAKNKRSKRRRSSVQQGIVRKKKFLLKEPDFECYDNLHKKVSISSIRDLILYALTDVNLAPRWCTLENRKSVERVVIVFLRGLNENDFGLNDFKPQINPVEIDSENVNSHLDNFPKIFDLAIPLQSPGSKKCIFSTFTSLVSYSLTPKEKNKLLKENEGKRITIPQLFLTLDQLLAHNYPIHPDIEGATSEMIEPTKDYVYTKKFDHDGSKTFALDCEMCKGVNGKVLARVSLINWDNEVLIDKYIKPDAEIIDYLTQWSGITPEKLENVETTLEDIQKEILNIVSSDDTLVGHSLEVDLEVLKLKHINIIDTSICFDHPRGPPAKASLKNLMGLHLDRVVQNEISGHDSVEDCISCMDLLKLKIEKGWLFGKQFGIESLYSRIAKCNKMVFSTTGEKIPKSSLVIDYTVPKMFVQVEKRLQAKNDEDAINLFHENQNKHDLVILKLRELEWFRNMASLKPDSVQLPDNENEMLDKVNQRLNTIYNDLSPNTLLLVSTENGDTSKMLRLQKLQKDFKEKYENGQASGEPTADEAWTEERQLELSDALEEARNTILFATLKTK
ncbi:Rnh70 protein [Martiniozyma asiatica (nom. inval.)]|nr:Rnh70 protein [Martiniozyma asiatica]